MKYLFSAIFIISTAIHLFASAKQNKKLRNITKPFILLSLLGYYCCACEMPAVSVILALIFSWIGDVLLIPSGTKWFTAGGISFMISHAFFALSYYKYIEFAKVPIVCIVLLGAFFAVIVSIIFSKLKPHLPKALFYPMFLYLLINGTMNCFAIFRYITDPCIPSLITCIGAIMFFISDSILFFVRFDKDSKIKTHFWVMFTYSFGELLIVLGLI